MKDLACIILAAGEGKRMHTSIPKVLHKLAGRPIIKYVLETADSIGATGTVIVIGFGAEGVKKYLLYGAKVVLQKRLLGTADAVKVAMPHLNKKVEDIIVLYGDTPLLTTATLNEVITRHRRDKSSATLLTAKVPDPAGYGRIERKNGKIVKILEDSQLITKRQKALSEINSGVVCFNKAALLKFIGKVLPNRENGEYYLTDVIGRMVGQGMDVASVTAQDPDEIMGINSRNDLAKAHRVIRNRLINYHMSRGVTILDPFNTYIEQGVKIGRDTVIHPYSIIESDCVIGSQCSIGPFAHLRSGVCLDDGVIVGNFVELVRTSIKEGTKVRHFSYLGDTTVGKYVNIGAGTITANYDGKRKNPTIIEDGSFVGSGSIFVAPVKVGKNAVTGAGSVVTRGHNVPDGATVIGVPAKALKR